ncbi:MAG TPA: NADH-quinone oxidoreductase subunit A [Vicinamibacteria bacterium]|nr:NADH-quinone oxidoreductase subunit A [Vicinamibacteria bacterium]
MPNYVPLLVLAALVLGFAVSTPFLSRAIGKPRHSPAKDSTYECGVPPVGTARERFPIKFYLVCMLFILFDVDAAFLYPWGLMFNEFVAKGAGVYVLTEMGVFIALLGGGFVYVWKVGALDW